MDKAQSLCVHIHMRIYIYVTLERMFGAKEILNNLGFRMRNSNTCPMFFHPFHVGSIPPFLPILLSFLTAVYL